VIRSTIQERFDAKWIPEPNSGCWLWTAAVNFPSSHRATDIRPIIGTGNGRRTDYAYRVSWRLHNGDVPAGMDVCHRCDVPICVNPDHLFLGTRQDNLQDMVMKGRQGRHGRLRGEAHPMVLLTENDVRNIRSSAEPAQILANRFGVSRPTISAIRTGRNWKHVI